MNDFNHQLTGFTSPVSIRLTHSNSLTKEVCTRQNICISRHGSRTITAMAAPKFPEDSSSSEEIKGVEQMRSRLEGLFGVDDTESDIDNNGIFDGKILRSVIQDRWGVQYDVQPQKRHGRVYVQIMWRYFEQQSFYMEEDEFASHCEAVAQLLQQWDAVDYFCDYISSIKKRPVVGITINIPIPGVDAQSVVLE